MPHRFTVVTIIFSFFLLIFLVTHPTLGKHGEGIDNTPSVHPIHEKILELSLLMEYDRLLLAELRKPFPYSRDEAGAYLERIKELSLHADPVRLGPLINKVKHAASTYFDWLAEEYKTRDELVEAYIITGAHEFRKNFEDLRSAILLTVINRLDTILHIIERY